MKFLIDAQLPPALADRLASVGFEASHVDRIGLGAASDLAIWRQAPALADALITKDVDFVQLARSDATGVAVIWIRIGNVTKTLVPFKCGLYVLAGLYVVLLNAEQLPALVSGIDEKYIGFSVTMPGKRAALEFVA